MTLIWAAYAGGLCWLVRGQSETLLFSPLSFYSNISVSWRCSWVGGWLSGGLILTSSGPWHPHRESKSSILNTMPARQIYRSPWSRHWYSSEQLLASASANQYWEAHREGKKVKAEGHCHSATCWLSERAHFKAGRSWNCPGLIGGCNSGEEFHSPIRFSFWQNKTINLKLNCTAEMLFTLKPWRNLLNHHYLNRDAHNENQKNEMLNEKKKKQSKKETRIWHTKTNQSITVIFWILFYEILN